MSGSISKVKQVSSTFVHDFFSVKKLKVAEWWLSSSQKFDINFKCIQHQTRY